MLDMDEVLARTKKINEKLSKEMDENIQKGRDSVQEMEEAEEARQAAQAAAMQAANDQRQVEILGQMLGEDALQQMMANQAAMQAALEQQIAAYAELSPEELMSKLVGEEMMETLKSDEMGLFAAALETLAGEDDEEEDLDFEEINIDELYKFLKEIMAAVAALPEKPAVVYDHKAEQWDNFGILLSGIISHLNMHELDMLDVEEHIPLFEQKIASVVRNYWGIQGREGLLETLQYLFNEGYDQRYQVYLEAAAPEELFDEELDEEDQESIRRGWQFVQHFKDQYPPEFLRGWDLGRAAMLTRWGYYLGWITQKEALTILSDIAQDAVKHFASWRDFGRSYQFGGALWKVLCGAGDVFSYLSSLTTAISALLDETKEEEEGGQWAKQPWPTVETKKCH